MTDDAVQNNHAPETKVDVLIVGAGPTGLTLACELARHGVSFRLIDKAPVASDKSKALAVHARSLEVFEDMGIVEKFLTYGLKIRGINIFAERNQIAHMTLDELDSFYSFTISLPQSDTERILMERLAELGFAVERALELVELKQDSNSVECKLRSTEGDEETIKTRWVVGCDGAHSVVRKQLNLQFSGSKYPDLLQLGDVEVHGDLRSDELYVFNSDEGLLALFPYGGNRYRIAASKTAEHDETDQVIKSLPAPTLVELQAITNRRSPIALTLSNQHWTNALYLHRRHVSQYRVGNCFLAGDAAHIHTPAGGQGMNTGIQDSYNLAWKLALVAKGIASDTILDSYNSERLGIALGVLKMTDFMMNVNTLKNPIAKKLRNALAPVLTAQEVFQKRARSAISELGLNYRESAIVEEHVSPMINAVARKPDMPTLTDCFQFKNGPEAGDRAPDAFLNDQAQQPVRLHELLRGTKHTLLTFSGDETSEAEIDQFKNIADTISNLARDLLNVVFIVDSEESRERCALLNESGSDTVSGTLSKSAHEAESNRAAAANVFAHKSGVSLAAGADLPDQRVRVFADRDGSTHQRYGAGANCMYLIRPDGYVGFRCQPMDLNLLVDYLKRIFDRALASSS